MPDAIEVGDWVQMRGLKRIYEVVRVRQLSHDVVFLVDGNQSWHVPSAVARVAPRFWIKGPRDPYAGVSRSA